MLLHCCGDAKKFLRNQFHDKAFIFWYWYYIFIIILYYLNINFNNIIFSIIVFSIYFNIFKYSMKLCILYYTVCVTNYACFLLDIYTHFVKSKSISFWSEKVILKVKIVWVGEKGLKVVHFELPRRNCLKHIEILKKGR